MSRRHVETITDYLVVAISPALIIFLVGSLVLFVLQVSYDGEFDGRLRFACLLFVIAAVLVARIAIEEGREYASMFAIPLGIVTILSMLKYTDIHLLLVLPLVGFIWWSTDKLTWDCTVLDDRQDASGEGLLQTVGVNHADRLQQELDKEATTDTSSAQEQSLWQRWLAHRRRHHTPGVWVIYFGIAAIPLFGLGQVLVSPEMRPAAFLLLCIYVASALSLLMTTSFLQMRRYLIQRRLPFTDQMASIWLGAGGVMIVGLMMVCLLLPRPNTGYSILESFEKVSSRAGLNASRFGVGEEGVKDDQQSGTGESEQEQAETESDDGRQSSNDAKQGNRPGNKAESEGSEHAKSGHEDSKPDVRDDRSPQDRNSDRDTADDRKSDESETDDSETDDQSKDSERDNSERQNSPRQFENTSTPPSLSNPLQNLTFGNLAKWIYFLLLAVAVIYVLIRYGREIGAAIQAFLTDVRDFLSRLFGGRPRMAAEQENDEEPEPVVAAKPFSSFQDPFLAGTVSRFSPQQLVSYTFEALQAWAEERNCGRTTEQTPLEFASQISTNNREVGTLARNLAILYNQAAYAPGTLGVEAVEHMRNMWGALRGRASRNVQRRTESS